MFEETMMQGRAKNGPGARQEIGRSVPKSRQELARGVAEARQERILILEQKH